MGKELVSLQTEEDKSQEVGGLINSRCCKYDTYLLKGGGHVFEL